MLDVEPLSRNRVRPVAFLFSAMSLYDWFHPVRQAPDSYFVILIIPSFVAVGLWWCIYLNLSV